MTKCWYSDKSKETENELNENKQKKANQNSPTKTKPKIINLNMKKTLKNVFVCPFGYTECTETKELTLTPGLCVCVYVCCYCCIEQAQKQNKTNQSTCNKINYECLAHFWFFFLSHSHIRTHYTVWIRMIQKMFWIFSLELLHSEQLFLAVHLSWKWPNSSSVTSFFWCILSFHRQLFTEFTVKIFLGHATA